MLVSYCAPNQVSDKPGSQGFSELRKWVSPDTRYSVRFNQLLLYLRNPLSRDLANSSFSALIYTLCTMLLQLHEVSPSEISNVPCKNDFTLFEANDIEIKSFRLLIFMYSDPSN
jgi:hypothetical protein